MSAAWTDVRSLARPVGDGFAPYRWAASVDEVAERHGVLREAVLKFDQNTPPLPGIPQVPLAQSMATLHEYPDGTYRALCEAAAAYAGVAAENVVVGAGADDLILLVARVFLGPGTRAAIEPPTYALYRIATTLAGAEVVGPEEGATVRWVCNPNNPTGETTSPEEIVELAHRAPETIVVVDEAYVEYGGTSCAPWVEKLPNLVVLRTLSKAFGFAALRVGYALAHRDTAALLDERRAPAPVAGPAAAIAAAALREPRLGDVETTVAERERVRIALLAAGHDCPPTAHELRVPAHRGALWPAGSRPRGSSCGRFPRASASPSAAPRRTTCCCARSGPSRDRRSAATRRSSARRPRPRCV